MSRSAIFGVGLALLAMGCSTSPASGELAVGDDSQALAALRALLKPDARNVHYIEIIGEMPPEFALRVVSNFSNEHPSYPICTRYTLGGPSPLGLERRVSYKVTSQTGVFRLAVPLDYAAFKDPLSSACADWYHGSTSIGVDYQGKRVLLTNLGLVRASQLKNYYKGRPLVSPIDIVCSKALLESPDPKVAWKACKTTLGQEYSWWFGLTEEFVSTMPSLESDFSAPSPLRLRIRVSE